MKSILTKFHLQFKIFLTWVFVLPHLIILSQTATVSVSSNVNTSNGAYIIFNNANLSFSDDAAFPGDGTFLFTGNTPVTISNTAGAVSLPRIYHENTGGITLEEGDLYIREDFSFDNGIFDTGSQTVIFEAGSTTSGASNDAFVHGPVQKMGDTEFIFPVGDMNTDGLAFYQPVRIFEHEGSSTIQAQYFAMDVRDVYTTATYTDEIGACDHWDIIKIEGADVRVALQFTNPDPDYCNVINDPATLFFARFNGLEWDLMSSAATGNEVISDQIINPASETSGYGPYVLSSQSNLNVLPIELIFFTAKTLDNQLVETNWATASETNNDYFTVERSRDALLFEPIGTVQGAGNSNQQLDYSLVDDAPFSGLSYYRLKQTDFDGSFAYSNIVAVQIGNADAAFSLDQIYRTETGVDLRYQAFAPYLTVEIFDLAGKRVFGDIIENVDGKSIIHPNLARGAYIARLTHGMKSATAKFFF